MEGGGAAQGPHQQDLWLPRMIHPSEDRPRKAEISKSVGFTSWAGTALLWGGPEPLFRKEREMGSG